MHCAPVAELADDLAALFDGDVFIGDVAGDARRALYEKVPGHDRSIDEACEACDIGGDAAPDFAFRALDERGAGQVAFDLAIDMQVDRSADIAGDENVAADNRKGCVFSPGCGQSQPLGRSAA